MKEQKNIERLFQEKFKDFEAIPPQNSWDTIASRLNEKKKKKREEEKSKERKHKQTFLAQWVYPPLIDPHKA